MLTPNLPIKIIFEDFFVTLKNNNLKIKKLCLGEHYIIYSNKVLFVYILIIRNVLTYLVVHKKL